MKISHLNAVVVVATFCLPLPIYATDLLKAELKPCLANGINMGEVKSCGKKWALKAGMVHLTADGALKASVTGLVLNDPTTEKYNGTPDGVDGVAAAVICQDKITAQTDTVPLSQTGDATIEAKVAVADRCPDAKVVLRERYEGKISGWLASTAGQANRP
jgi:hypothetical protein